jgi:cold shock protein
MLTGTVKFYNDAKGFGFIVDDESKSEVFVHATGLVDKITQNDKVTYEVKEGKKGPNAIDVKKAE